MDKVKLSTCDMCNNAGERVYKVNRDNFMSNFIDKRNAMDKLD